MRRPSKTENPTLLLHLPHGIFLPAGASLQIDNGKAEVQDLQKRPITMSLPLKGFAEAFRKLPRGLAPVGSVHVLQH